MVLHFKNVTTWFVSNSTGRELHKDS